MTNERRSTTRRVIDSRLRLEIAVTVFTTFAAGMAVGLMIASMVIGRWL